MIQVLEMFGVIVGITKARECPIEIRQDGIPDGNPNRLGIIKREQNLIKRGHDRIAWVLRSQLLVPMVEVVTQDVVDDVFH